MGLAASQCRILYLTARQSDVEYQMMAIAEQQQRLTTETQQISTEYANAIDDKNIKIRITNSAETTGYSYENITYNNLKDAGYYLVDAAVDAIYLKADTSAEGATTWDVPKDADGNPISKVYTVNGNTVTDEDGNTTQNTNNLDNGQYIKIGDKYYALKDAKAYIEHYKLINNKVTEGVVNLAKIDGTNITRYPNFLANEDMRVDFDTSNDAAAYAKYTAAMNKINSKDKELETELSLLETEQTAITKELESIDSIIKDNVEKSYGIFAKS
ncbi:hypothetical protein IKQ26_05435 [bacterium]|nr:hypothetical protein [bacterium]